MINEKYIYNIIHNFVLGLLEKHPKGGESYFDELDDFLINNFFFDLIINKSYTKNTIFICSGKFGIAFYNYIYIKNIPCIVFNGDLRKEDNYAYIISRNINLIDRDFLYRDFVYIDDSYFSGKTMRKCMSFLNIKEYRTFVLYDGSKQKEVKSIYKYYDNF